MTCAEFHEGVVALAAGAADAEERAALEAHLAEPGPHQGCAEALARAYEAAALLALALPPVKPTPPLWARIEGELGIAEKSSRPRRKILPWVIAGAAVQLCLLAVADRNRASSDQVVAERRLAETQGQLDQAEENAHRLQALVTVERDQCNQRVAGLRGDIQMERQLAALLERPGTRVLPLAPAGKGNLGASAVLNPQLHRAFVMGSALPMRAGKDYQLWTLRKGKPFPAGFLHDLGNGITLGEVDSKLLAEGAEAIAISLEPAGGSPTPTEVVALGKVQG